MANNFIEFLEMMSENHLKKNCDQIVGEIISLSKKKNRIIYPEDVLVSKDMNGSAKNKN